MLKDDITNECKRFFGVWADKIMSINSVSIQLMFPPDFRRVSMNAANTCSIKFEHDESNLHNIEGWRDAGCPQNWPFDTTTIPDTFELMTSPSTKITLDSIQSVRDILQQYFNMQNIAIYFSREQQSRQSQQQISNMTTSNKKLFKLSVAGCVEPTATRQLIRNIVQRMSTSEITYQISADGTLGRGRLSDLCTNSEKYTWIRETLMVDIESDLKFLFS